MLQATLLLLAMSPDAFTRTLHVRGEGIELRRTDAAGDSLVCAAPCDRVVDVHEGDSFYFAGPGVTESKTFELASGGDLTLNVDRGNHNLFVAGLLVTAGGAVAMTAGAIVWGNSDPCFSKLFCQSSDPNAWFYTAPPSNQRSLQVTAEILAVTGGLAMITGAVLAISNRTTWSEGAVVTPTEHGLALVGRF